jgi:exosortase
MNARANRIAWLAAALLAWLWAWRHLSIEWRTNEQYEFGFGVPVLCLYLAWSRWSGPMPAGRAGRAAGVAIAGWIAVALGELLRWHDPIWRLTAGLLVTGATLVSAAAFYRLGGLPLLRREAFPLGFAWTGVPWPVPVELVLTQNLLRFVTAFTTSCIGALGIPAVQHGNAIELANGVLGVDDACSGIRSLQATVMATLFLGEYFRLRVGNRLWLVAGGAGISFALNCARVMTLTLIHHSWSAATEMKCHDPAGATATAMTFVLVFILAARLRDRHPLPPAETPAAAATPGYDGFAVCGSFAAIPILAAAWFATLSDGSLNASERPQWTLDPARVPDTWRLERVQPRPGEKTGLQFSTWQGYRLQSPDGWSVQVIHLDWKRGESMPSLAFYHTPAMCMPWVGWTQVGQPRKLTLPLRTGEVPCVAYRFTQDGAGVLVLQSLSSGGENGFHILDPAHLEDRRRRLLTLWKAPLKQVNEELLIYLPARADENGELQAAAAAMDVLLADTGR